MEPTNDHEAEIARLVDARSKQGDLPKSTIADIASALSFMMSQSDTKFLVRYVIWRRDHPISSETQD
jgi:hypothetical protein